MKLIDKIIMIFSLIVLVTLILIKNFSYKSEIILLDYAAFKTTNIITSTINEALNNVLYENVYDNIIQEYKDTNDNIISIDFDNIVVNRMLYLITENLLKDELEKTNNQIYYIPLGASFNIPILNNLGPKIPFKVEIIKSINNEAKINLKEYGINSSLIQLIINIKLKIKVIMPFRSKIVEVDKNIILDSKIVQGKVPNYYGGLISGSLK